MLQHRMVTDGNYAWERSRTQTGDSVVHLRLKHCVNEERQINVVGKLNAIGKNYG